MKPAVVWIPIFLMASSFQAAAAINPNSQVGPVVSQSDVMQWTIGLALVIFLILISAWILRRVNQLSFSQGSRLRILGGISVGTRERVILLQVGEKQLLLGVAPGRIATLHVLEPDELTRFGDEGPANSGAASFAERIKQVMQRL